MPSEDEQLQELADSIFKMAELDFDGKPKIYGDTALDAIALGLITLSDELKSTVVAKAEAEQANVAKADFIAKMSHELRTPLTNIICSTELLSESALTDRQEQLVTNIANSGSLLLRLINDILDYSTSNQSSIAFIPTAFNLNELVKGSVDMNQDKAIAKGLELAFEYIGSTDEIVYCDRDRLGQILMNLISNSIKFTESGVITVTVTTISDDGNLDISIAVKDTGIGMTPETVGQVFVPFFSLDSTLRRQHGGAGLGMTITKSLVDEMGGSINIESEFGKGSEINAILNLPLRSESKIKGQHDCSPTLAGKRVLIVDDTLQVAEITTKMLNALQVHAETVVSGRAALSISNLSKYDAILMDCHMPNMDGLETATRLIQNNPNLDLRIIAFSANTSDEFQQLCHEAGMLHQLVKPFSLSDLSRVIQDHAR